MNIEKEREAFLEWHFLEWKLNCAVTDTVEEARKLYERIYKPLHRDQISEREHGFKAWMAGKAHGAEKLEGCVVVPVWVATDFLLPDEGELVLFLDKNNVIHEGFLNTDYVDGPYGENGEDFGDNQTLWTSNSSGEELLLSKVKYWMTRPNGPVEAARGGK